MIWIVPPKSGEGMVIRVLYVDDNENNVYML